MSSATANLLIVEDDFALRTSFCQIFSTIGLRVRSAKDGFSALTEIWSEIPDIILSDLNMPGMSGFELLPVVRRWFPAIKIIAMSGAYSGECIPPAVTADAFFEKGSNLLSLLQLVKTMSPLAVPSPLPVSDQLGQIASSH